MDEEEKKRILEEGACQAVAAIYLWLDDNPKILKAWRMFGKEILDEAITNFIEKRLLKHCVDEVKPQRFEIKRIARKIAEAYINIRKDCHPVSEFFWGVAGKIMGWPKEIPAGVRLFR